eukprot:CAMPEP_0178444298 /NCGR_PEP_ID=MMETSP0689_2-20121128/39412_1 /TAXON_ID=160604 /ORGANISM="Amphidinium massartii, Strain CS-259" /LENGTH=107 /DNA_ID=CAMNT_0020068479 /DNA_START=240 /DNA_END=563 /DNA_ORIENTATION=-
MAANPARAVGVRLAKELPDAVVLRCRDVDGARSFPQLSLLLGEQQFLCEGMLRHPDQELLKIKLFGGSTALATLGQVPFEQVKWDLLSLWEIFSERGSQEREELMGR